MQTLQCKLHKILFKIPTNDQEFSTGILHNEIERLCEHKERYSSCTFENITNSA